MKKSPQDILDEFGKKVVNEAYDNQLRFIMNPIEDLRKTDGYLNLFNNMSSIQKNEIENYSQELLKGQLFNILKILEENEKFKSIYENNGAQTDLNQISEMLKSELIIKNGWIDKFSKYNKK